MTVRMELKEALDIYDVAFAASGQEALDVLGREGIDAIVLDLVMPGLSGSETCLRIKSEAAWHDIPLIILSAQSEAEALKECIDDGADDYVTKSTDYDVLKARLKALLRRRKNETEIMHLNVALKEANAELEHRVQERTAALEAHGRKLDRTNEELVSATKVKSEFLANMSHELRTPLNSINGFSEVLYDQTFGPLNEKQKVYVNYILTSGKHLLSLINQILDTSKIEAGKMKLQVSTVDLKNLLKEISLLMANLAGKKRLEMVLEVSEELPTIEADEVKIRQIIYNLLTNAVNFSPAGGKIGMRAKRAGTAIEIVVWDSGVGIAKENMTKIFDGFFRVDTAYSRLTEGTGLGLSLSKKLVELHGGSLVMESEGLNKGSLVRVTLPIPAPFFIDKAS